jgi:GLPGLI family protein
MKKAIILILIWLSNFVNAQDMMLEYQGIYQSYQITDYTLQISDTVSLWQIATDNYKAKIKDTTILVNGTKYNTYEVIRVNNPIYDNYKHKQFVIKNKKNKRIIFTKVLGDKRYFVEDTLNAMHWNLENEKKIILGYHCKKATTTFRGRNYEVFYTEDIPVSDGPWKFSGLPGLILEAKSTDGDYSFVVNKIIINYNENIDLPVYENDQLQSWVDYVEEVKNYYDQKIAYSRAKAIQTNRTGGGSVRISAMEIIHPIFSATGVVLYKMKK